MTMKRIGCGLRLVAGRHRGGEGLTVGSKNGEKPTIFIVDDDPAMRDLLVLMLDSLDANLETFASAEAFLAVWDAERHGCLLLDMRLPGMDGLALYSRLNGLGSVLPVVFLTGYADVATARHVLMSGASDFLQKPVEKKNLLDSVTAAFEQGHRAREALQMSASLTELTPREWEVMSLVVAGKPNKVICCELGISQKTVEAHRARVMSKTQAGSVADLVRMFSAFRHERRGAGEGHDADTAWRRAQ